MRDAIAWPHPTLAQELLLPLAPGHLGQTSDGENIAAQQLLRDCLQFTGASGVLLAPSLQHARRWILQALQRSEQTPVLLPPNATHDLVETVKRCGAAIRFGQLDADLCLHDARVHPLVWLQSPLGLPARSEVEAAITVAEYGDTLPGGQLSDPSRHPAAVTIFGLHLSADPAQAGALLAFVDESLYLQVKAQSQAVEAHFFSQAARQLARLQTLAPQQHAALDTVWTGLHEAAGLPTLRPTSSVALTHGIAVRVPAECSPGAFWHYAQGENTPVLWVSQLRPLHYRAVTVAGQSATYLERWLLVPVGPQNSLEASQQTVLGIVKAAEYLGVRWRTNPARAARYATLLVEKYGPDHDAYRPVFATENPAQQGPSLPDDLGNHDRLRPPVVFQPKGVRPSLGCARSGSAPFWLPPGRPIIVPSSLFATVG